MHLPWTKQVEADSFRREWDRDAHAGRISRSLWGGSREQHNHRAGKEVPSAKNGSRSSGKK